MRPSIPDNTDIHAPLTRDIHQAHGIMKLLTDKLSIDEIHNMIFLWLETIPESNQVNIQCTKIKKLIKKHSFSTLFKTGPQIPAYSEIRNPNVAATFVLLTYLTRSCWNLFSKSEHEEELFPPYNEDYKIVEKFVRSIDLTTVMNSMFDMIKQTVGAELFIYYWQKWEEEDQNRSEDNVGKLRSSNEQLFVNFKILSAFVDVCFFIFNDTGKEFNHSSDL
jgi:hypothetical protein